MKINNKVDTVQILRGIAAVLVLLCHFDIYFDSLFPGTKSLFSNGVVGVDIFFIISGFVIYISYKSDSALEFFIKRFFRVYIPAAIAILLTVKIAGIGIAGNGAFLKSILFIPLSNENPPFYGYNLLAVVWTLTYEMYFYVLFAIAIALSKRYGGIGVISSSLVALSVFGGQYLMNGVVDINAMSYVYQGKESLIPNQLISLSGNPIILEFIVGILFGYLFKEKRHSVRLSKKISNMLIMTLSSIFIVRYFGPNFEHGILDAGIYSSCLFMAFIIWHRGIETGIYNEPSKKLIYLGAISFSIYLTHVAVIIGFIEKYSYWLREGGQLVGGLVVTSLVSVFFYHIIEINAQKCGGLISRSLKK
ncbi:TPA: acyltransferase family protein [Kluyvera cryocrescens]